MIQTLKYWKVFEIFWSKVHQNAVSDLETKFQLILTSTFWNFHENALESVLGRKSLFYSTFDSNFKILKSFRNFLVKSTSECYFWLANKVSTYSNEYFLNFHENALVSVLGRKSHFRPLLIQTLKYWKVFEIFWSKYMIYKCFLDEWKKLRSLGHYQILTQIAYPNLCKKLENWLNFGVFLHSL